MKQTLTLRVGIKDLRIALTGVAKVIARKTTLPVLGCIRCHLHTDRPDTVTLTATDLDTFLELDVPASVITEGVPFLVPMTDLRDALKGGSGGDTVILKSEPDARVVVIRENGSTPIPRILKGLPESEFPELPRVGKPAFTLDERARDTLLQAMACSSTDPSRYVLQGACLEEGRSFVGTDGRHLYHGNSMTLPVKKTVILPYRKVLDWKPLRDSGNWTMALDGDWIRLRGDHWTLTSKLIDGRYPNWKQVVPPDEQFRSSATLSGDSLTQVAATIRSLPGEKLSNKPVGLRLNHNSLALLARSDEDSDPIEIPVADAKTTGPDATVFLNREYLTKALHFGLNRVEVIDATSPVRLRPESVSDREMIVMPVRVPASCPATAQTKKTETQPTPMKTETEKPEDKTNHNGGHNGRHHPAVTQEETPLERAVAQIAAVKDIMRQATTGLTELANALKQVKADHKSTEKEIRQVRSTIRTLQKVDL